jgi:N-acetylmuramoyl-L-alanine amidase
MNNTSRKLFISAGHYGATSGAVVGGLTEAELNNKFLEAINFGTKVPKGTLRSKIDWVNERATKDDIAIEIHCNYSSDVNKSGIEVYFRDEDDKKLALLLDEAMYKQFGKTLGGFSVDLHTLGCDQMLGSVHHDSESYVQSLGWCRELKCPAVIVEVEYMTSKEGLKILLDSETPAKVAKAIYEVFSPVVEASVTSCEVEKKEIAKLKEQLSWYDKWVGRLLRLLR